MSVSRIAIRRAIYGKLAGDTTLNGMLHSPPAGRAHNIFHSEVDEGALFPYVVFNRQSPNTPTQTLGNPDAIGNELWLVKAVDREANTISSDKVDAIADRIVTLLNDATLSISGGTSLFFRRMSDVEYPETVGDQRHLHSGSLFRLRYQ